MQKLTAIVEVKKYDGEMELVVGRDLTHEQTNELGADQRIGTNWNELGTNWGQTDLRDLLGIIHDSTE